MRFTEQSLLVAAFVGSLAVLPNGSNHNSHVVSAFSSTPASSCGTSVGNDRAAFLPFSSLSSCRTTFSSMNPVFARSVSASSRTTALFGGIFYNDFEDTPIGDDAQQRNDNKKKKKKSIEDGGSSSDALYGNKDDNDEDDDEYIDTDALGDWRTFRMNLADDDNDEDGKEGDTNAKKEKTKTISAENELLLRSQSKKLADEYASGVWAHPTATAETGGLVVRMPLEMELFRNHEHSFAGKMLRKELGLGDSAKGSKDSDRPLAVVFKKAQFLIEEQMALVEAEAQDGQVDPLALSDELNEILQLYLDNQSNWQEVALVVDNNESDGTATTVVLNRPMAFKLTDNLAQLVVHGAYSTDDGKAKPSMAKFRKAFAEECAVYVGGPDQQGEAAMLIHGFGDLPGAREIAPGIYEGGLIAAVEGILSGLYQPLDFRFFVGRHEYTNRMLDLSVVLGKLQPIATARSVALKQCISLPKPLFHEVLELCGSDMKEISKLELTKRSDVRYVIEEEEEDVE